MGIVWLIAAMAVVMLGLPAFPLLLARLGGGSDALESSFAQQQVPCASGPIPASALLVLHRTPGMTMYSNQGDLMNVDASWLCRAPDGSYLLALGQGQRMPNEMAWLPWNRQPLEIHWSWRPMNEAQVRQMLAHDRAALRAIFPAPPAHQDGTHATS